MLANGGNSIDVTILKDVVNQDGTIENKGSVKEYLNDLLELTKINNEDLNIKKENINVVLEGMKSVTTETRRNSIFSI